jgi:chitodextrinase
MAIALLLVDKTRLPAVAGSALDDLIPGTRPADLVVIIALGAGGAVLSPGAPLAVLRGQAIRWPRTLGARTGDEVSRVLAEIYDLYAALGDDSVPVRLHAYLDWREFGGLRAALNQFEHFAEVPAAPVGVTPVKGSPLPARGSSIRPGRRKSSSVRASGNVPGLRPGGRGRRWRVWTAAAASVAVIAAVGAVYGIAPWRHLAALGPTGLASDGRTASSIDLTWLGPATGPAPDQYQILRDGDVAGTVSGDTLRFDDQGLVPATSYDYQVRAHQDGVWSRPSAGLRAWTKTPPLSQALLGEDGTVDEVIQSGGAAVTGWKDGEAWHDTWQFSPRCPAATRPCAANVSGFVDGAAFTAKLDQSGKGYAGTANINSYFHCGTDKSKYTTSTLHIAITPTWADVRDKRWEVTSFKGTMAWHLDYNPDGGCSEVEVDFNISA